jgi:hypothetical protein
MGGDEGDDDEDDGEHCGLSGSWLVLMGTGRGRGAGLGDDEGVEAWVMTRGLRHR